MRKDNQRREKIVKTLCFGKWVGLENPKKYREGDQGIVMIIYYFPEHKN